MVFRQGLTLIGAAFGGHSPLAIHITRRSAFSERQGADPPVMAGVAALLTVTSLPHAWPAQRAANVEPIAALRAD